MITRRTVTKGFAGLAAAAWAPHIGRAQGAAAPTPSPSPVAKTHAGSIQGLSQGAVLSFLGVPYGAPTAAQHASCRHGRPPPWTGVRDAKSFGDSCPQVPLGVSPFARKSAPDQAPTPPTAMQLQLASLFSRGPRDLRQSEDCLVLNVWTRALDAAKRPVMVWLHGGGFAVGSASNPAY